MEVITTYKAVDGRTFETERECRTHETALELAQQGLDEFLQSRNLSEQEHVAARSAIIDWLAGNGPRNLTTVSLDGLDLSVHTRHGLRTGKIESIADLANSTENALLSIPTIGRKSLNEIKAALQTRGLSLRG